MLRGLQFALSLVASVPVSAQLAAEAPETTIRAETLGAVARPGAVELSGDAAATVEQAIAEAGGAGVDAYRFATLLLRVVAETPPRFPCVAPGARHAALLMDADPVLRDQGALIAGLLDGRVQRLFAPDRPFGRLGSDRDATTLRSGDLVALPQRTDQVHVVFADGAVAAVAHQPQLMAADYLDQMPGDRLARRRDYVLHYPDGRVVGLTLQAWNAQPTAVPPGSMLAPAAGCLPVPD